MKLSVVEKYVCSSFYNVGSTTSYLHFSELRRVMKHRRGLAFAVPFLIVGIVSQLMFPQVIESAQIASITSIIIATIAGYCTTIILEKRGIVPTIDRSE